MSCLSCLSCLSCVYVPVSLMAAEVPARQGGGLGPDVLIVESTYGSTKHQSRAEREEVFTSFVRKIVKRQGKCLIPVSHTVIILS